MKINYIYILFWLNFLLFDPIINMVLVRHRRHLHKEPPKERRLVQLSGIKDPTMTESLTTAADYDVRTVLILKNDDSIDSFYDRELFSLPGGNKDDLKKFNDELLKLR